MELTRTKKRAIVIGAIGVLLIGGGGAAFAYWTTTGEGSGTATTGTSAAFVIDSSAPTGNALTPGGPPQTVAFTVTNPSEGSQILNSVIVTVAEDNGDPWTGVAGCSDLDYTVNAPTITYGQIPPSGVVNGTVTVQMNNLGSNQDACKNATVPLYFVAS